MCQVQPACTVALNGQAVAVPASAGPTHVAAPVPMQGPTPGGVDNPLPSIFRPWLALTCPVIVDWVSHKACSCQGCAERAWWHHHVWPTRTLCSASPTYHGGCCSSPGCAPRWRGEEAPGLAAEALLLALPSRSADQKALHTPGVAAAGRQRNTSCRRGALLAGPACRRRPCILSSASMTAAGTSCTHSPSCCLSLLQATTSRAPRGSTAGHYPGCSGAAECAARRCGATCRWRHKPAPVFHAQPHGSWSV